MLIEFLGISIEEIFKSRERVEVKQKNYKPKNEEEIMEKRNGWLELMVLYPDASKTYIRGIDRSVYTWLHKYDNEWLKKNSPIKKVGNRKDQVIDWDKRDEDVLVLVKDVVHKLRTTEGKPERVTKTLVARKINKVTLIQRYLGKLPKTEAFLEKNIEGLEEFQMRRVKWAIRELEKEGEVKEWDVIIKAGLSKKYYNKLKNKINSEICNELNKKYT